MAKRRISAARRAAALKGWRTRRAAERRRSQSARKGWRTRRHESIQRQERRAARRLQEREKRQAQRQRRPELPRRRRPTIDHIVTVQVKSPRRSPMIRDLIVPAPAGTPLRELLSKAKSDLDVPKGFWRHSTALEVLEGPTTDRRSTELR